MERAFATERRGYFFYWPCSIGSAGPNPATRLDWSGGLGMSLFPPRYYRDMSTGILDLLGSVGTFVLAAPLGLAGVELLVGGNLAVGGSLLGVALAMVAVDRYITTPGDLPSMVAEKLTGAIARNPDDD